MEGSKDAKEKLTHSFRHGTKLTEDQTSKTQTVNENEKKTKILLKYPS